MRWPHAAPLPCRWGWFLQWNRYGCGTCSGSAPGHDLVEKVVQVERLGQLDPVYLALAAAVRDSGGEDARALAGAKLLRGLKLDPWASPSPTPGITSRRSPGIISMMPNIPMPEISGMPLNPVGGEEVSFATSLKACVWFLGACCIKGFDEGHDNECGRQEVTHPQLTESWICCRDLCNRPLGFTRRQTPPNLRYLSACSAPMPTNR
jgi:hypothetical protein